MRRSIPIYGGTLKVRVVSSFSDPHVEAVTIDKTSPFELTVLIKARTPADVIAHEAVHCAVHVFRWVGSGVSVEHDEPFAYLVQWFTASIIEAQKR